MSETQLTGKILFDGTYAPSRFVEVWENGGVFLLDEVDAADSNVMLTINAALSGGEGSELSVTNRIGNTVAKKHKDTYIICAANTWGTGSVDYSGREVLDAAFLARFDTSKIEINYDEEMELTLATDKYKAFAKKIQKIREIKGLHRNITTRTIEGVRNILASDHPKFGTEAYAVEVITRGWTREEKAKIQSIFK